MKGSNNSGGSSPADTAAPLFREVQRFRQLIFWLPVLGVTVYIWYEFAQQVVLGHPQGSNPIPNWLAWVLTIVFGVGFPVLGLVLRLITEVGPEVLTVRLAPLPAARIPLKEVTGAAVREYSPIKEYGGWGIRISRTRGRAYNAYGNRGVQLSLANGSLVLIGSQRPDELLSALRAAGAVVGTTWVKT